MPHPEREKFTIKADAAFGDWLRAVSQATRTPIPTLIEQSLAFMAGARRWAPPPPRISKETVRQSPSATPTQPERTP